MGRTQEVVSFIYYFPSREIPPQRNVFSPADKDAGLDSVLRDATLNNLHPASGPDGGTGCLTMIDRPEFPGNNNLYDADKQTWQKINDHYWLGWYTDRKPSPALLQRPKTVDGEWIDLDGKEWLVPVCGPLRSKLPLAFAMALDGEWRADVQAEYADLMKACETAMDDAESAGKPKADTAAILGRQLTFCCRMLGVNYHVGPHEITILRVLTQDAFVEVLNTSFGITTINRENDEKKLSAAAEAA